MSEGECPQCKTDSFEVWVTNFWIALHCLACSYLELYKRVVEE